jgi:hypothetical protein
VTTTDPCAGCAELDKRIPLPTVARYLELAAAARELVDDGVLELVQGNVPLASLQMRVVMRGIMPYAAKGAKRRLSR